MTFLYPFPQKYSQIFVSAEALNILHLKLLLNWIYYLKKKRGR